MYQVVVTGSGHGRATATTASKWRIYSSHVPNPQSRISNEGTTQKMNENFLLLARLSVYLMEIYMVTLPWGNFVLNVKFFKK